MPLDVRKASGFPHITLFISDAMPLRKIQGIAPMKKLESGRKGEAFPHIRRQSRRPNDDRQ
jgi:hypothetical protein